MEFLCEALRRLWQSGRTPPDIFALVLSYPRTPTHNAIPLITLDQRFRWQSAKPIQVEEYLEKLPFLKHSKQQSVELILGEIEARGIKATAEVIVEYLTRFPDLKENLKQRFATMIGADHQPDDITIDPSFVALPSLPSKTNHLDSNFTHSPRYSIRRLLGEGPFGRAFLAEDRELNRLVAIKFPTDSRLKHAAPRVKYLAEARAVACLKHPHIVPVYDVTERSDGTIYVISKYIEGQTLERRIIHKLPSYNEGARIVGSIASALAHAHQRNLVHRDVKPSNIFLENNSGAAYMADFGFVFQGDVNEPRERILGTPPYMSPEQVRGEIKKLDARSDIFALGAILYEILTGKRAFSGNTPKEVFQEVIHRNPTSIRRSNPSVPIELERICFKALAKKPEDRFQSASLFAQDLFRWYLGTTAITAGKSVYRDSRNRVNGDLQTSAPVDENKSTSLVGFSRR
jgi:serine/threonine protein kinase